MRVAKEKIVSPMSWPLVWKKKFPQPHENMVGCPIHSSAGVLGRRWALAVLRDIAFCEGVRFSDLLRSNLGLTPRVLVMRLKDLQNEGVIQRVKDGRGGITYALTRQGEDALPILAAFSFYGMRHHAGEVFADGKPRNIDKVLPGGPDERLGDFQYYALKRRMPPPPRPSKA